MKTYLKRFKAYRVFRKKVRRSQLYRFLVLIGFYILSSYEILTEKNDPFAELEAYCLFIGHGRSGHSIIGALLDAHPSIVLPDETDTLRYLNAGFSKKQVGYMLLARSRRQAEQMRTKKGREGNVYSYAVPNQWQGRYEKIAVIGDTKASVSVRWLKRYPNLLRKLKETVGVKLKVVHIVRNPFDNISTMTIKDYASIQDAMDSYFDNCKAIIDIYKLIDPADLLIARHEELIEAPEDFLMKMCEFLGVDASDEYLRDAGGIIFKSPSKTRSKLEWHEQEIAVVHENIKHFDFLDGYSFDI